MLYSIFTQTISAWFTYINYVIFTTSLEFKEIKSIGAPVLLNINILLRDRWC